jgi:hypothetical protein
MAAQRAGVTSKPVVFMLEFIPEPTDCGMVKPVDPNFKSKMPVVTPDRSWRCR